MSTRSDISQILLVTLGPLVALREAVMNPNEIIARPARWPSIRCRGQLAPLACECGRSTVTAIAVRLERRRLTFADVEPVVAERASMMFGLCETRLLSASGRPSNEL